MQPLPFSNSSQNPLPSSLRSIPLNYLPETSLFTSESQLSSPDETSIYDKLALAEQFKLEALSNLPTIKGETLPYLYPKQNQLDPSISSKIEPQDQQDNEATSFEGKDEWAKPYTLPKGWTNEKDQELLKLGKQWKGEWKNIARRFTDRAVTPRFVKYRFRDLTSAPKQTRAKFHPFEDLMLAKYYDKYGSDWTKIADHFENRTPVMLKNRYYSYIRKQGLLGLLTEKAKEMEQNENGPYENPQVFIGQATSEGDIFCKDELNSASEVKTEPGVVSESAAEIAALKKQVEFYYTLFLKTQFELDNLKAKTSERAH